MVCLSLFDVPMILIRVDPFVLVTYALGFASSSRQLTLPNHFPLGAPRRKFSVLPARIARTRSVLCVELAPTPKIGTQPVNVAVHDRERLGFFVCRESRPVDARLRFTPPLPMARNVSWR